MRTDKLKRELVWYLIFGVVAYSFFIRNEALTSIAFIFAGIYCLILRKEILQDTLEGHEKRSKRFPILFPPIENKEKYYKAGNVLAIIVGAGFVLSGTLTLLYPSTLRGNSDQIVSNVATSTPQIAELPNASTTFQLLCENQTHLSMSFPDASHIQVITNNKKTLLLPLENWPGMIVYGNEKYAYTFVEGYSGQVIATDRSGPYSTICHVATSTL